MKFNYEMNTVEQCKFLSRVRSRRDWKRPQMHFEAKAKHEVYVVSEMISRKSNNRLKFSVSLICIVSKTKEEKVLRWSFCVIKLKLSICFLSFMYVGAFFGGAKTEFFASFKSPSTMIRVWSEWVENFRRWIFQ